MSILDLVSIASVMPFIAALVDPEYINNNKSFANLSHLLGFIGKFDSIKFGFAFFLLIAMSQICKAIISYFQWKYILFCESSICTRLVSGYLHKPYEWFLNMHSAELGKAVLFDVNQVITLALMPIINIVTQTIVSTSLIVLIIGVDIQVAIVISLVLGVAYLAIYKIINLKLRKTGEELHEANERKHVLLDEAFGGIKEIKVGGFEEVYLSRFCNYSQIYATNCAYQHAVSGLPRFALEAAAYGAMVVAVIILKMQNQSVSQFLPIIALYAMAGSRLMPAVQQIYGNFTSLKFASAPLNSLHKTFLSFDKYRHAVKYSNSRVLGKVILSGISYRYPDSQVNTLKDISLEIEPGQIIGIVGTTGSGKSTLIDVVMGLLVPSAGNVTVDSREIFPNLTAEWRKSIGYVPQNIYIADDSISANIAFGVAPNEIDHERVVYASKLALLHEFITFKLPNGYATQLGERGVRLSGGERQRIGIARALYRAPSVLVLDEATSALDNKTEKDFMEVLHGLDTQITIIMIAHRLTTLRNCDVIYVLENGEVSDFGTYEELREKNQFFS